MRSTFFLVVLAFVVGIAEGNRQTRANVPNSCPKWDCVQVYAMWHTGHSSSVVAAHVKGMPDATDYGEKDVFATGSTVKQPRSISGQYDQWVFLACVPHCGKSNDTNGVLQWQEPQQVSTVGAGMSPPGRKNQDRWVCSQGGGNKSGDQNNYNTSGDPPPGYKAGSD
jgi:hypothetical protein